MRSFPYHKAIINVSQVKHRHVVNKWIYVISFKLSHKNICIKRYTDGSHCRPFEFLPFKMKLVRVSISAKNVVMTFVGTVLFVYQELFLLLLCQYPSIVTRYISSGTLLISSILMRKSFVSFKIFFSLGVLNVNQNVWKF